MSTIKVLFQIILKAQLHLSFNSSHDTLRTRPSPLFISCYFLNYKWFCPSCDYFLHIHFMPKVFLCCFFFTCKDKLKKIFSHTLTHKVNDRSVQTTKTSEGVPFSLFFFWRLWPWTMIYSQQDCCMILRLIFNYFFVIDLVHRIFFFTKTLPWKWFLSPHYHAKRNRTCSYLGR